MRKEMMRMGKAAILVTAMSVAVCIYLWFRDVRRIMRGHLSTVQSAKSQLDTFMANAERSEWDEEFAAVLKRSENIYRQAVDVYNANRRRLWVRLPAFFMGFSFISGKNVPAQKPSKKSQKKKEPYIGSVRFFKNLILLGVIVMIAVPTVFAIRLAKSLSATEEYIQTQNAENEALQHENELLAEEIKHLPVVEPTKAELWDLFKAESPYAELYPELYAPQELDASLYEKGVVYLTFDDGPSERTGEILDILKEKDVKATFFVVGNDSEQGKEMLRRIVEEGHTLGMHTYSHRYNDIYQSVEAYLDDMYKIFSQIKEATGTEPTLFRFPGGSINAYNGNIYQELISEMLRRGFVPFDWNMANSDAITNRLVPTEELIYNVLHNAEQKDRGVVLMHDSSWKTTTVEALAPTIDGLREKGFELKALTHEVMPILFSYNN